MGGRVYDFPSLRTSTKGRVLIWNERLWEVERKRKLEEGERHAEAADGGVDPLTEFIQFTGTEKS